MDAFPTQSIIRRAALPLTLAVVVIIIQISFPQLGSSRSFLALYPTILVISFCERLHWFAKNRRLAERLRDQIAQERDERLRLLERQSESETRFKVMADTVPVLVWMCDIEKACTWFNKGWLDWTGRNLEEEMGFGWLDGVHPNDRDRCLRVFTENFEMRQSFYMEYRLRHHSGEYRWISDRGQPRFGSNGSFEGYVGGCMDIHDQVLARREFEMRARLVEDMPTPFFAVDQNWRVSYWNSAAEEIQGHAKSQILGKNLWEYFPGLEGSEFGTVYRRVAREKKRITTEIFYADDRRWFQISAFPFENGVAVAFQDTTERKRLERIIAESEEKFRTLSNSIPHLVWQANSAGDVEHYNDRICEYTDYRFEDGVWKWAPMIHPDDLEATVEAWRHAVEMKSLYTMEHRIRMRDGSYRWHLSRGIPHRRPDGEIERWYGSATDVHETRLMRDELTKAKDDAERANQLKSAFLANMSHEIRTPLGAMIGFADLLRDQGLSHEERSRYVEILSRNGENLSVIINDILDLSKIEAGHLNLELRDFEPIELTSEVISLLSVKAREKNLGLSLEIEESAPDSIVSDPERIRQILLNIVGNAIKFTHSGKVVVRIDGRSVANGAGRELRIDVTDTGIGVQEGQRERIFETFVQADGSMARTYGGTGLGLSLSRRLARALGGDVELLESRSGQGATFRIRIADQKNAAVNVLPSSSRSKPPSAPVSSLHPEGVLSGRSILIVDDSIDNRQLIETYLRKRGARTESATNGREGFELALRLDVDAVLMDIQMPEMDGYEATRKLRESGFTKPIIALTAHVMTDFKKRCQDVGCTDYLTKPIVAEDLIRAIARSFSECKAQDSEMSDDEGARSADRVI